jgi:hypothetical protein
MISLTQLGIIAVHGLDSMDSLDLSGIEESVTWDRFWD